MISKRYRYLLEVRRFINNGFACSVFCTDVCLSRLSLCDTNVPPSPPSALTPYLGIQNISLSNFISHAKQCYYRCFATLLLLACNGYNNDHDSLSWKEH